MNKMIKYLVLALLPVFSIAHAQSTGAYVTDSSGQVVKSGFGLCWRTSSWTPQTATKECDPDLFKDEVTPPKKEVVVIKDDIKPEPPVIKPQPVNVVIKAFFDFDKSDLTTDSRAKLKEIADKIKSYNVEVITVSGHADRIGTEDYNQRLSERRAAVVKAELVKLGVDASKIYTEAKGESQPEVNCPGKTSAKVIACLAPNRRVQVEVVGALK